jgi:WD40 repeat protein
MPNFSRWVLGLFAGACLLPLGSVHADDGAEIKKLITQLGNEDADQRREAAERLQEIGEPATAALREAAKTHADPDVRLRAGLVLRSIETSRFGEIKSLGQGTNGYWFNRVAFTADGKSALVTGGGVIRYDLENGKEVYRVLEVQFGRNGLALSKDRTLFLTGHQHDKLVRLGEVKTGKVLRSFEGHTAGVHAVALSPNGDRAVSGGDDGTLRLWEVKTGKELRQFKDVTDRVFCAAFAPDGRHVASGHYGPRTSFLVRLWDADTGKEVRSFKGHTGDVTAVAFLPDGRSLLSASIDGTLRLWEIETGKELRTMKHEGGVRDVAVTSDGKRAVSAGWGDKAVRLWELTTGRELHCFEGHATRVLGVAISPDGRQALSCDANHTVRLWRLAK